MVVIDDCMCMSYGFNLSLHPFDQCNRSADAQSRLCDLLSQVVQLAQLGHAYGLEHLEPGLDALRGRYPLDSQTAKPVGQVGARLNARQRRTLRRAFERAKATLDCGSNEPVASQPTAAADSQPDSSDEVATAGESKGTSGDPEPHTVERQFSSASTDTGIR